MSYVTTSTCRTCGAFCPIDVTIDGDHIEKVEGNPRAPLYEGFICPKGRALAADQNNPKRLMQSLKRMPDGYYEPISSEQLVEEITAKVKVLLDNYGPSTIAGYNGSGPLTEQQAGVTMMSSFLRAIGSDLHFGANTIDQPGINIADALHGRWDGGAIRPENLDLFLIVGGNPIISKQYFPQNPGQQLKRNIKNGMKLIVIDPRRTETAKRAQVHLQCIPGEDPTIVAGLIHLVIANGTLDRKFVDLNTQGVAELAEAVSKFTPEYVCQRAGIAEKDLREAARLIGESKRGHLGSGVGPSMATRGSLTSYLILCLQTLRGFWARAGEEAIQPKVLLPRRKFKAQPNAPTPAWGFGKKFRVRGLQATVAGLPCSALPEEILMPGEGQIRALFMHAGALVTWPQEELARKALESLELLVIHDVDFSPTASVASYVIATKKQLEIPVITQLMEVATYMHPGYGWSDPYAAYQPALVQPPAGSDLLESWQIYYRMAQKLGLQLHCSPLLGADPNRAVALDMTREPTTDEIYEAMCRDSAIPLAEIKKYPDGNVFDAARETIAARDADCSARLELANRDMLAELAVVRAESAADRRGINSEFPYQYVPRRLANMNNSTRLPDGVMKTRYNPAYMHSSDLAHLGISPGEVIEIRSRHGSIISIADVDDNMRPGVLSMCHGYGNGTGKDYDPRRDGANVNRLLNWDDDYDPYHGMPRMGALPIAVTRVAT